MSDEQSTEQPVESKVVHAVGLVVSSQQLGDAKVKYIEMRMQEAITRALDEGVPISNSEEIKRRINAAQERARREVEA